MALSRFVLPFADVGSGIKPSVGAKLFFFITGTSTQKNTFNCPDGTTANSNPVIADENGLFPNIFISGTFKVILKDRNDVQIWEADPVISFANTSDGVFNKNFLTLRGGLAATSAIENTDLVDGDLVNVIDRTSGNGGNSLWKVVLASTVTISAGAPNTGRIVASTGVPTLALVLVTTDVMDLAAWGGISTVGENLTVSTDNSAALVEAINFISGPLNSVGSTTSKRGEITLGGLQWTFDAVDVQERWGWSLNCGNSKMYFNGQWNLGGCAFFDLHLGSCEPVASKLGTITGIEMFKSTSAGERVHNFNISFKLMASFNRAFFTDNSWSQGVITGGQFNNNNKCIESNGGGENVVLKNWVFAGHASQTSEIVLFTGSNAICENWQFETLPSASRNDIRVVTGAGMQLVNVLMNKSGGIRIEGGSGKIIGGNIADSISTIVINNVSGTEWSCDNLTIRWTVNNGTGDSFTDGTGKIGIKTLVGWRSCRGNVIRRAGDGIVTTSTSNQYYDNTVIDSKVNNYLLTGAENVTITGSISLDQPGQKGITVTGVNGDGNRFLNIAWGSLTNASDRYNLSAGNGQNSVIIDGGKGEPSVLGIIAGSGSMWQRAAFGVGTSLYVKSLFGSGSSDWNPVGTVLRTTAQLTDINDFSNTEGKHDGRQARNITNNQVLYAEDSTAGGVWRDSQGVVVITPV